MVKDFCRQQHTKSGISGLTTSHREKLVKRIRHRLDLGRRQDKDEALSSSDDDVERPRKNIGNFNAMRQTRQIEIGWLCDTKGVLKQVRQKQGGGTRKISVPRTRQKMDTQSLGKDLFFPAGISTHGPATQFQFDVWNFKHQPIDGNTTVADYCTNQVNSQWLDSISVSQPYSLPPVNEPAESTASTDQHFRYLSSSDEEGLPSIPVDGNKCLTIMK